MAPPCAYVCVPVTRVRHKARRDASSPSLCAPSLSLHKLSCTFSFAVHTVASPITTTTTTPKYLDPSPVAAGQPVAAQEHDQLEHRRISPPLVPTPQPQPQVGPQGMHARPARTFIPSTPNFVVSDSGAAHFQDHPEPSPISSLPPGQPTPAGAHDASTADGHAATQSSADYFASAVSEKYPPARSAAAAGPASSRSSVHVPLLARDAEDDDMSDAPYHSLPRPGGGGPGRSSGGLLDGLLHSRLRLHPLALVPALMVGAVLALSGVFGPTMGTSRSNMVVVRLAPAPPPPT